MLPGPRAGSSLSTCAPVLLEMQGGEKMHGEDTAGTGWGAPAQGFGPCDSTLWYRRSSRHRPWGSFYPHWDLEMKGYKCPPSPRSVA